MVFLLINFIIGLLFPLISPPVSISTPDPSTICPDNDIIAPCTCYKTCGICPAIIECSGIKRLDQLQRAFENSEDYSFWEFHIVHSVFPFVPADSLITKRVRKLVLQDDIFVTLFDTPPSELNLLNEMELNNVTVQTGMRWEVFTPLTKLKELKIYYLNIRKIDKAFLSNFPSGITGMYFSNTQTRILGDDTFSKLTNLTRININGSPLKTLKRSMFPENPKIFAMNFSRTDIETLPDDLFDNMPKLVNLDFSFTKLAVLREETFGRIMPQLLLLFLEDNPLDCNCKMKWLTQTSIPYKLFADCTTPKAVEGLAIDKLEPKHFAHCDM